MKRIFILLIMSNNLECRIAAIGKFNLSLPSFMTVKFVYLYFLHVSQNKYFKPYTIVYFNNFRL